MQVFISYSAKDKGLAKLLAEQMSEAGYTVSWPDDRSLLPGDNMALKLGQALERSDAMIVLVSPEAARSPSVREEISYALGSPRYAGRVVPVEVRRTTEMPWVLGRLGTVRIGRNRARLAERVISQLEPTAE
ncbi:MAG TPA: toll/interleukin-1 receptor domain-containing protein [Phycisphaerae bacterium]|nr:toll/interleukin-1 receptor domain-containing protein [Phycisphaerae bacterium]